jgi:hypothetical protein
MLTDANYILGYTQVPPTQPLRGTHHRFAAANVELPPLPAGGYDGTEDGFIAELANEISATTFIEAIRVGLVGGTTGAKLGPCARPCTLFTRFDLRRELYDISEVRTVRDLVAKLGLNKDAWVYYRRDIRTEALIPLTIKSTVYNRWSILIVPATMTDPVLLDYKANWWRIARSCPVRVPY